MIRISRFAAIVSLSALTNIASAATVNAINDYTDALAQVDVSQSLTLPGSWSAAPLTVNPDASMSNVYRSPFEAAGHTSAGYYSVGVSSHYNSANNPAVLDLNGQSSSFSLLWGSPDRYNRLELFSGNTMVASILGNEFNILAYEASFVEILADGPSEYFTSAQFYSDGTNAFEFSNISASPVPIPAAAWLFGSAMLGFISLGKRKKLKA